MIPTITAPAAPALASIPPSCSGIYPLPGGTDAFAARAVLAAAARRSIDAQYYIWHGDLAGTLLFVELVRAAERGVRVRLLLDDNNTPGLDGRLAALDAHPNIEIRLFNPFKHRGARALDYVLEFARLNRRMHNKSFTIDNQATILGGRNVGDEYFDAGADISFEDLDVIGVGPVVADVSRVFEAYWNSAPAVPVSHVVPPASTPAVERVVHAAEELEAGEQARRYRSAVRDTTLVHDLAAGRLQLEWAATRLVSDPPTKVLAGRGAVTAPVLDRLREVLGAADREIDIVSPYFVPTRDGVAALRSIAARQVRIRVLTNSLAATDVAAVHAGYAKYRVPLLEAGIQLYELKPTYRGATPGKRGARGGSSGASLHAKCFAVDRCRAYVGSFNFDPRSARLNTEMGVVLDAPALATRIAAELDRELLSAAYQVRLGPGGRLEWLSRDAAGEQRYRLEPSASRARRLGVGLLSLLPIERFL